MNLDKFYSIYLECMKPQVQLLLWKKEARRIFQFGQQTDEDQGVASQVTW